MYTRLIHSNLNFIQLYASQILYTFTLYIYFSLQTTLRVVSTPHLLVPLWKTFHWPAIVGQGADLLLLMYPHLASGAGLTPQL